MRRTRSTHTHNSKFDFEDKTEKLTFYAHDVTLHGGPQRNNKYYTWIPRRENAFGVVRSWGRDSVAKPNWGCPTSCVCIKCPTCKEYPLIMTHDNDCRAWTECSGKECTGVVIVPGTNVPVYEYTVNFH